MPWFNTNPVDKFDDFLQKNSLLTDKIIRMCAIYLKHGSFRHHSEAFTWLQTLTISLVNCYTEQRKQVEPDYDPNNLLHRITESDDANIANLADEHRKKLKQAIKAVLNVVEARSSKKVFSTQLLSTEKNNCSLAKTLLDRLVGKTGSRLNLEALDEEEVKQYEIALKDYITASQTPSLPSIRVTR